MNSDGFIEDDLDPSVFEQLDHIEAAHFFTAQKSVTDKPNTPARPTLAKDDSFCDLTLDIDESELQRIDNAVENAYSRFNDPVAGLSKIQHTKGSVQTTLFGDVLPQKASFSKSNQAPRITSKSTKQSPRNTFGQQAPKVKQWDQTAFAKSGLKSSKPKGKGKLGPEDDDAEEHSEKIEFEQFPAPFVPVGPPPPMKLLPDLLEAKHWFYPLNKPKRDYQFNIVKHSLFENALVALPTGLGKTFIAGVVMLNFYRWFPEGKVVFVAPTKPLVAQQIDACHKTCGIPGRDAVELTGQNPRLLRARAWKEKRVFYMTPQTLVNDLVTENCDPSSIILLVIDEAHRGTGDYAYAQVVRFMMAKNPHFRVLALTATPGGTPEAVQSIIDCLHISRIEIRDENSLDLKEYIHKKNIKQHIIKMSDDIGIVKDLLGKLMEVDMKALRDRGVLYCGDPSTLHPYHPQATMQRLKRDQKWAYAPLARLSSLARAMGYLMEATMGMCYTHLQELSHKKDDDGQESKKAQKLSADPKFQAVMTELETQRNKGFSFHPKMDRLKGLILQHFADRIIDETTEEDEGTRAMVFVTYRECVDEIVEMLNAEKPLIRATKFVGQGTDKQGKRGFAQKEQLEVIRKFKAGEWNVLVATSVGEEGLDIGEIDLIVCYDAQKTPIRMLQRVGRTGRKREGYVHVLLSAGREEFNLDKAKATYKDVQRTITRGDQLELYGDVERLLPDHVKPDCLEKVMEIEEYVRETATRKPSTAGERNSENTKKRKRNDDMGRNIPAGASTGFVSAAKLVTKGSRPKKAKISEKQFESAGLDDDTDLDIEAGLILAQPPRRTASTPATVTTAAKKGKLRKSATIGAKRPRKTSNKKTVEHLPTFSQKGLDDSDDVAIERHSGPSDRSTAAIVQRRNNRSTSPKYCSPSPELPDIIELTSSDNDRHFSVHTPSPVHTIKSLPSAPSSERDARHLSKEPPGSNLGHAGSSPGERLSVLPRSGTDAERPSMAWLIDEDDEPVYEIVDSSPILEKIRNASPHLVADAGSDDHAPLSSPGIHHVRSPSSKSQHLQSPMRDMSSPEWHLSSSPQPVERKSEHPDSAIMRSPVSDAYNDYPEPSFPVRFPRKPQKQLFMGAPSIASPLLESPIAAKRRIRRGRTRSSKDQVPEAPNRQWGRSALSVGEVDQWIDMEAVHSGDELTSGSSHGDDDSESESDRLFLQELPETQMPMSYDQTLAYRQSLLTQHPGGEAPVFANRPVRRGPFAGGGGSGTRQQRTIFSSPSGDNLPDEYALGSFVVDDDVEISFAGNSSMEV